jgi:GTP cyclohydrolase I
MSSPPAPTPLADRRVALPDIQNTAPAHALALGAVGVTGLRLPLVLDAGPAIATLRLSVDLPAHQRGAHMSRFRKAIDAVPEGLSPHAFAAALAAVLLERHPYATHADVRLEVDCAIGDLVLPVRARSRAGLESPAFSGSGHSLAFRLWGSTVCPCAWAMSGERYAHVQRAELSVELFEPALPLAELHALCSTAFSAPVAMLLDRPAEKALVDRMFAHPRFVEDVAREAVAALRSARAGAAARLTATAFESIHPYDCSAAWEGVL